MGRVGTNESVLSLAVSNSQSLRTTVPIYITKQMNLKVGDHLDWDLDKEGNQWLAKITKNDDM